MIKYADYLKLRLPGDNPYTGQNKEGWKKLRKPGINEGWGIYKGVPNGPTATLPQYPVIPGMTDPMLSEVQNRYNKLISQAYYAAKRQAPKGPWPSNRMYAFPVDGKDMRLSQRRAQYVQGILNMFRNKLRPNTPEYNTTRAYLMHRGGVNWYNDNNQTRPIQAQPAPTIPGIDKKLLQAYGDMIGSTTPTNSRNGKNTDVAWS